MKDQVSFGYEEVSPDEKTRRVGAVFSNVAAKYDLMNDAMSGGMHRLWKDRFVRRVKPQPGEQILDMAGGTGDIAFRLAAKGGDGDRLRYQPGDARCRDRAGDGAWPGRSRLVAPECRGAEFPRPFLRCLHDRLRHP